MGAALVLFLKGCDGVLQMSTRGSAGPPGDMVAAIQGVRVFMAVLLLSFIGIFLSLAVGAYVLDTDIRKRFVLNLFGTPLTREEFIVGKWLGAFSVFVVYWLFAAAAFCYVVGVSPMKLNERHAWVLAALAATMVVGFAIAAFLSLWLHPIAAFVGTFAVQGAAQFVMVLLAFWGSAWWAPIAKGVFYILPSPARQNPVAFAMRLSPLPEAAMPGMEPDATVFMHNLSYAALLMWVFWVLLRRRSLRG
jgi:ABC-type transport system involved in multi-copper enzyme maturation permease subunit